jgi:hypothetical protein
LKKNAKELYMSELLRKADFCEKRARYEQGRLKYAEALMWYQRAKGFRIKAEKEGENDSLS